MRFRRQIGTPAALSLAARCEHRSGSDGRQRREKGAEFSFCLLSANPEVFEKSSGHFGEHLKGWTASVPLTPAQLHTGSSDSVSVEGGERSPSSPSFPASPRLPVWVDCMVLDLLVPRLQPAFGCPPASSFAQSLLSRISRSPSFRWPGAFCARHREAAPSCTFIPNEPAVASIETEARVCALHNGLCVMAWATDHSQSVHYV